MFAKKFLVLVAVLVLGSMLTACGTLRVSIVEDDGTETRVVDVNTDKLCGMEAIDCANASPTATPAATLPTVDPSATATPTVNPTVNPTASSVLSEDTVIAFGKSGSFHAVWDATVGSWTLGMWETSRMTSGYSLAELKQKGDNFEFIMPFDGILDQSSGEVLVNDEPWTLGNPIVHKDGVTKVITAGSIVKVTFSGTPSDGLQIWFIKK